ncbi:hypothetical protein GN244_ATG04081 [Phytophthora infestans]|uniref:Uncharacterized protein n=1 Tax=Phytophthora infestans TaxID=4787 RepID=A0A833S9W5_PHYIN|nr:hypothetical protein GN244_ATG04081 [Phytophthora infestans]
MGDHRCSVQVHICGSTNCVMLLDIQRDHSVHKCVEVQCLRQCFMRGCKNICGEKDHFHGQLNESRMFAEENGVSITPDLSEDSVDDAAATHMCLGSHACPDMCQSDVRCPCCAYYCNMHFGHMGLHATSHCNMRQTYFIAKDNDIDIEDRKYFEVSSWTEFWTTIGWEDPCTDDERILFSKCPFQCDAPEHDEPDNSALYLGNAFVEKDEVINARRVAFTRIETRG